MTELHFLQLSRLTGEYMAYMYYRVENEMLGYIKLALEQQNSHIASFQLN